MHKLLNYFSAEHGWIRCWFPTINQHQLTLMLAEGLVRTTTWEPLVNQDEEADFPSSPSGVGCIEHVLNMVTSSSCYYKVS
jgi:hypothetical protein